MTPLDDVSERLSEIRERVEAATEGPWRAEDDPDALMYDVTISDRVPLNEDFRGAIATLSQTNQIPKTEQLDNAEFLAAARSDVPYLLSLVEEVRDQLCKYTCECGPASNPDPKEHADYCLYRSALRDAAQEGAE